MRLHIVPRFVSDIVHIFSKRTTQSMQVLSLMLRAVQEVQPWWCHLWRRRSSETQQLPQL